MAVRFRESLAGVCSGAGRAMKPGGGEIGQAFQVDGAMAGRGAARLFAGGQARLRFPVQARQLGG